MPHPLPTPPRLLLFDLDQTLLDNTTVARGALTGTMAEHPEIFTGLAPETVFARWSSINMKLWGEYCSGTINEMQLRHQRMARILVWACDQSGACYTESLAAGFSAGYFDRFIRGSRLLDGVDDMLRSLPEDLPLCVVTNGFSDVQRARLEATGLTGRVQGIVISEEAGARKPDPAIFRTALDRFGLAPTEAVMIGDSLRWDIAGAHAAGIATVWLRPGDTTDVDTEGHATATVSSIEQLSTLLRSLIPIPATP